MNKVKEINKDEERRKRIISNVLNSEKLLVEQKEVLKRFDEWNMGKGLRTATRRTYISILYNFAQFIKKSFENVEKEDIIRYFSSTTELSPITVIGRKITIKLFFEWLDRSDAVSWI